jgi:hypothetical protein
MDAAISAAEVGGKLARGNWREAQSSATTPPEPVGRLATDASHIASGADVSDPNTTFEELFEKAKNKPTAGSQGESPAENK